MNCRTQSIYFGTPAANHNAVSEALSFTRTIGMERKAARLPDTILRAARADRLRKEKDRLQVDGARITRVTERDGEAWPRMITMANEEGVGMLGLSRLSGHSFYELAWEGGLHVRRFEVSGTSRNRVRWATSDRTRIASSRAKCLPRQMRGPAPKGK